jgi:hypothetical protein
VSEQPNHYQDVPRNDPEFRDLARRVFAGLLQLQRQEVNAPDPSQSIQEKSDEETTNHA